MKTLAIIVVLLIANCLVAKERVPAGTIIPCRLDNPRVEGNWIHCQAVALESVFSHGRTVVRKGDTVTGIVVRKDVAPSLNGGELVTASRTQEIFLSHTGFQKGQIISVLFEH